MSNPVKKMSFPAVAAILVASAGISGCLEEANELVNNIREANQELQGEENLVSDNVAMLSWYAPSKRVNGESLLIHDLREYVIHYGQDPANLDKNVRMANDNSGEMDFFFSHPEGGEWFFAVQAVDVDGKVSTLSQVVSKTL
ncbi:MAG: hypothetical protein R3296_08060 [Oleiphilaceae bacterium]|nr:hypothetical protein [Oleiphilaceae bacterium]